MNREIGLFESKERISNKRCLQMEQRRGATEGNRCAMGYRELISWVWVTGRVLKLTCELVP